MSAEAAPRPSMAQESRPCARFCSSCSGVISISKRAACRRLLQFAAFERKHLQSGLVAGGAPKHQFSLSVDIALQRLVLLRVSEGNGGE